MSAPTWPEIVVALLLLASGVVVLVAASGLIRLPNFFARMHAPALASTRFQTELEQQLLAAIDTN